MQEQVRHVFCAVLIVNKFWALIVGKHKVKKTLQKIHLV